MIFQMNKKLKFKFKGGFLMKKINKEIVKIEKIYKVIRKEIEIISGSKNSIDKELGYDSIRWGNLLFNWKI